MIQHACILKYGFTELLLINLSFKNQQVFSSEKPYSLSGFKFPSTKEERTEDITLSLINCLYSQHQTILEDKSEYSL